MTFERKRKIGVALGVPPRARFFPKNLVQSSRLCSGIWFDQDYLLV